MPRLAFAFAILGLLVVPVGCATSMGAATIDGARFDYNRAIVSSADEQLLLNLVRLRYRDTPLFLDVTGVVAQYTYSGSAGATPTLNPGPAQNVYEFGMGAGYTERPTISYAPLHGQEFVKRLLSPIPPETVVMLGQSGWSVERLLLACTREMNGITNARGAEGPTPEHAPRYDGFLALAGLLRRLQVAGAVDVKIDPRAGSLGTYLVVHPVVDPAVRADLAEFRRVLGLDPNADRYRIVGSVLGRADDEIGLVGRSVMGVMFYLSQAVEPPEEHREKGWVTVTRDAAGNPFDWSRIIGPLLRVRSKSSRPDDAFVAVEHRGHWFYIPDDDLNSKTTFGLLTQILSLQSATGTSSGPLLTIPTGG